MLRNKVVSVMPAKAGINSLSFCSPFSRVADRVRDDVLDRVVITASRTVVQSTGGTPVPPDQGYQHDRREIPSIGACRGRFAYSIIRPFENVFLFIQGAQCRLFGVIFVPVVRDFQVEPQFAHRHEKAAFHCVEQP
jgi:hypothetical protein